jgi:hypothetical protein
MRALSTSEAVAELIAGRRRVGVALGGGYVDVDGYCLALTAPGAPRMPNGLECALELRADEKVLVGDGRVEAHGSVVLAGPPWNPVPDTRYRPRWPQPVAFFPLRLAGRGPGLTPAGDDVLCGYVAGLRLFWGLNEEAATIAENAAARTTSLAATLLRHAARGELPEPAHAALESGDTGPLRAFGHTSGSCLLFGLALAGAGKR